MAILRGSPVMPSHFLLLFSCLMRLLGNVYCCVSSPHSGHFSGLLWWLPGPASAPGRHSCIHYCWLVGPPAQHNTGCCWLATENLNLRRHGQGRQWCLRSSKQLDSLKKRAASYGRRFSEMAKQTKLVKWGSHKWSVHQVDWAAQTSNLQEYCRKSPEWPNSTCFMNKSKYPGRFRTCLSKFF